MRGNGERMHPLIQRRSCPPNQHPTLLAMSCRARASLGSNWGNPIAAAYRFNADLILTRIFDSIAMWPPLRTM